MKINEEKLNEYAEGLIVAGFKDLCRIIHTINVEKGFDFDATDFNACAAKIALLHSEVSEMLEAERKPRESDHLPGETQIAEEVADVFIRLAHYAHKKGINLGDIILKKMNFNDGRPHMHEKRA